MADVVLDTHACVYALTAPARLGAFRAIGASLITKDGALADSGLVRTVWN